MKLVISLSTSETLRGKLCVWYSRFTELLIAIASGFLATGLVLTVLRLSYRIWLRRFWVEDAWAMVALICGTTALTTCWTYVEEGKEIVFVDITQSLHIPACSK